MKIHTTQAGDQFLIDHIESTTKWSQRNRHGVSVPRIFAIFGSVAAIVIIFLTLISIL